VAVTAVILLAFLVAQGVVCLLLGQQVQAQQDKEMLVGLELMRLQLVLVVAVAHLLLDKQ
jgi:hypothetical protein